MAVNNALGKVFAVAIIVAVVIVAIWIWGPLCALFGLFIVPATSEKGKALEITEKAKILATDPAVIVASQSSDLRSGIDTIKTETLSTAEQQSRDNLAALNASVNKGSI